MGEVLDPTWIAYSSPRTVSRELIAAGLDRVASHYGETAGGELRRDAWLGSRVGLGCLTDSERTCRWPGFSSDERFACVSGYVPTGWRRVAGGSEPERAALDLAAALDARPELAASELDAPAVILVADRARESLLLCNDCLGAGRLYEMRAGELTAWSNRLGALPLLLGRPPRADEDAWRLFAAAGWFVGSGTAIEGVRRVGPGTVIRTDGHEVERRRTGAIEAIVGAEALDFDAEVERFVAEAGEAADAAADLYPEQPRVDLSGGRDSRLAAAVFVARGLPARFVTSDMTAGEADVARGLFAALPGTADHQVRWGGGKAKVYEKGLLERARAVHRIHDGMRHASKVRGKMDLPPRFSPRAEISGHGGEIAHGFYYTTPRVLAKLERGGDALLARLDQAARRRHHAARDACYEAARGEFESRLQQGAAAGLSGPTLLDWFYLMERFSHRSGLAADAQRITFFSCRGFLGAAFAMTPAERLEDKLHRHATAALVPPWAGIPYFAAAKPRPWAIAERLRRRRYRTEKRPMIWEGRDGEEMEGLIAAGGAWTELFEPDRVREIWRASRGGRPDAHYQDVFEGIAYREAFEDHLDLLAGRAASGGSIAAADGRSAASAKIPLPENP